MWSIHDAGSWPKNRKDGATLNEKLQVLAIVSRFSHPDDAEDGDVPTCGNCGESFTDDIRWYDNDRFIYVCTDCAEAECSL